MPKSVVNGVELYWELRGNSGEPIVLVHGSWADHTAWEFLRPHLSQHFRVLAYDRRGHSLSERPDTQVSKEEDAADLAALIEHLDLSPVHVVGGSFGGAIGLQLAIDRPELLLSLIALEPPLFVTVKDPEAAKVASEAMARINAVGNVLGTSDLERGTRQFVESLLGPGAWEEAPEMMRQKMIDVAPTFLDETLDPNWPSIDLGELANFEAPVLLTAGELTAPEFPAVVDELARALPNAQKMTLPGIGHSLSRSQPDEFLALVRKFIEENSG